MYRLCFLSVYLDLPCVVACVMEIRNIASVSFLAGFGSVDEMDRFKITFRVPRYVLVTITVVSGVLSDLVGGTFSVFLCIGKPLMHAGIVWVDGCALLRSIGLEHCWPRDTRHT